MVIDASALMAVLQGEPERDHFVNVIGHASVRLISPINLLEAHMLMRTRRHEPGVRKLNELIAVSDIEIVATDSVQVAAARDAFDRYGKGRHAAGLNLADCFAYALSKTSGEPLLFKGGDFAKTDVLVAG